MQFISSTAVIKHTQAENLILHFEYALVETSTFQTQNTSLETYLNFYCSAGNFIERT